MNNGLLSVIIATYKHENMLYETLDSVLNQSYEKIQIIVAEDGNPDFSSEAVENYIETNAKENIVSFVILHANKNRGTVRNLNHALQHANGEYIKIIAGDDVFYNEQVFKQQVSFLQNNPQYSFVIGNVIECDAEMNMTNLTGFKPDGVLSLLEQPKDVLLKYIVRDNPGILAVQAICFRRTFYQWFGKFDEDYYLIEDLPMAVKAIDAGIPFGYIDFPCVKHRGSIGVSTSNEAFDPKRIMYYQDLLKYYDKTLSPIQNVVGKMYVRMRRQLIQFRIEYTLLKKTGEGLFKRFVLLFKNLPPVIYYVITEFRRFIFYFLR